MRCIDAHPLHRLLACRARLGFELAHQRSDGGSEAFSPTSYAGSFLQPARFFVLSLATQACA